MRGSSRAFGRAPIRQFRLRSAGRLVDLSAVDQRLRHAPDLVVNCTYMVGCAHGSRYALHPARRPFDPRRRAGTRSAQLRRDRRRRRPQRTHDHRLPGARRPAGDLRRAPRHPRRRLRDRGAVARRPGLTLLVRGLDAAAEDRLRPRARAVRLPSDPARPRLCLADRGGADLLLQRGREHRQVDRALLGEGRRGLPEVRGADGPRGAVREADDAARGARGRLQVPGRPRRAPARGGPDGRLLEARGPRARPRVHDVGWRPARRLLRARRPQGLDRVERRGRRLGGPAHPGHRLQPPSPRARRVRRDRGRLGSGDRRHGRDQRGDRRLRAQRGRRDPHRGRGRLDRRPQRLRGGRHARRRHRAASPDRRLRRAPENDRARAHRGRELPGRDR